MSSRTVFNPRYGFVMLYGPLEIKVEVRDLLFGHLFLCLTSVGIQV